MEADQSFYKQISIELEQALTHSLRFESRSKEMQLLQDYMKGEHQRKWGLKNQPLFIVGQPGVGKTALLCHAGFRFKQQVEGSCVIYRFVGSSLHRLNPSQLLDGICRQLCLVTGYQVDQKGPDLTSGSSAQTELVVKLLQYASAEEPIAVLVDAVDDLESYLGFAEALSWLPKRLPDHSSLLLSLRSSSKECFDALSDLYSGEAFLRLEPLKSADASTLISKHLQVRNKDLHPDQFEAIKNAVQNFEGGVQKALSCIPLYVTLCIEASSELRSFDSHVEARRGKRLVADFIAAVFFARDGLTRAELTDILSLCSDSMEEYFGSFGPDVPTLPAMQTFLLQRDLRAFLRDFWVGDVTSIKVKDYLVSEFVAKRYNLRSLDVADVFHEIEYAYFSGLQAHGESEKLSKQDALAEDQSMLSCQPIIFQRVGDNYIVNVRKLRELPYHICSVGGLLGFGIDPIERATKYTKSTQSMLKTRDGEKRFEREICNLPFIHAACTSNLINQLCDDLMIGSILYPGNVCIASYFDFVLENQCLLQAEPLQTFQCAVNSSSAYAADQFAKQAKAILEPTGPEPSIVPDVWLEVANKTESVAALLRTQLEHHTGIFSVAYSQGDDLLMMGGADGLVRLQDHKTGKVAREMECHGEAILHCCWSSDNSRLLTTSADFTACVWNTRSGALDVRLEGHQGEVLDGMFYHQDRVITASGDCTMRRWNVVTGQAEASFVGHESAVTVCVLMERADVIASGSYDKSVRIWSAKSGEQTHKLSEHAGVIYDLAYSESRNLLVSCSSDNTIKLWDLHQYVELETMSFHDSAIFCCEFDAQGETLAMGSVDGTLFHLDLDSQDLALNLGNISSTICGIAFCTTRKLISVATADGKVLLYDPSIANGIALQTTITHSTQIVHVEISHDGKNLISLAADGSVHVRVLDWNAETLIVHQLCDSREPAAACRFSPDGEYIATEHKFGLLIWQSSTCRLIGRMVHVYGTSEIVFPEMLDWEVRDETNHSYFMPMLARLDEQTSVSDEQLDLVISSEIDEEVNKLLEAPREEASEQDAAAPELTEGPLAEGATLQTEVKTQIDQTSPDNESSAGSEDGQGLWRYAMLLQEIEQRDATEVMEEDTDLEGSAPEKKDPDVEGGERASELADGIDDDDQASEEVEEGGASGSDAGEVRVSRCRCDPVAARRRWVDFDVQLTDESISWALFLLDALQKASDPASELFLMQRRILFHMRRAHVLTKHLALGMHGIPSINVLVRVVTNRSL
eukprot:763875-Hanusia_phi.AAC.5